MKSIIPENVSKHWFFLSIGGWAMGASAGIFAMFLFCIILLFFGVGGGEALGFGLGGLLVFSVLLSPIAGPILYSFITNLNKKLGKTSQDPFRISFEIGFLFVIVSLFWLL